MSDNPNNVDIAIQEVRQLQTYLFDPSKSPNDIFAFTNSIINTMEKARTEININYETISAKLTEQMNTGKIQK